MKEYYCPDCGKVFEENSIPASCPNCGCPSSVFKERYEMSKERNISPSLESSNDFGAEHTANALASITLVVGIIIGIIGFITGISLMAANSEALIFGIIAIIVGLILFLVFLVSWAFIKLLVNMSYRLTRLDNKYNP